MSLLKKGALTGAVLAAGALMVSVPVSPAEFFMQGLWMIFAVVAAVGAFLGASVVLAGRNVRNSPRVLLITLAGLLLLSQPPVSAYLRVSRANQRFLSTASSTQGVVVSKYVRGPALGLFVEYRVGGQSYRIIRVGQNPVIGTQAFRRWKKGDSIPVYFQPGAPAVVLVGEPGPERRFLIERLVKIWAFWGLMLTAHVLPFARWVRLWILLRGTPVPRPVT